MISLELLGRQIVQEAEPSTAMSARRRAILRPRVSGDFLRRYDNAPLPRPDLAAKILVEMGVPHDRSEAAFDMIRRNATSVGLLREIKGRMYVSLDRVATSGESSAPEVERAEPVDDTTDYETPKEKPEAAPRDHGHEELLRRVFVSHGKSRAFLDPIRQLLKFGELTAVVSVEQETVSQPVPDKVMSDMRSCGAAIIHVDAEGNEPGSEVSSQVAINANVLIEIGAALALYGRRFVLVVKDGVALPSNLQGLFVVRYEGDNLDSQTTIRLLSAINDIKNHKIPDRQPTA